jgi:sugar lactone lactonase YvrE
MLKKIILSTLIIVVILCLGGGLYLYRLVNPDIAEHFAGTCVSFELNGSGEDVQIDRAHGLAYVSLFDRQGLAKGDPVGPGDILRVDMTRTPLETVSAIADGPELRPHGISLFVDQTGQRYLFVINHPEDRATGQEKIERYREESPGMFRHQETFASPLIVRANDLVAIGARKFYVAQDVDRKSGEKLTELVYFDGNDYSVVADDIQSAGGINISTDYGTLYIAETGGKRIRVAGLDPFDGSVTSTQYIDLGTSPDNIDVAEDGSLWVAAHSNIAALVMHFIMGSNAPTQIVRIDLSGDQPRVEEKYLNAGQQISAGSVGVTYGNKMLIGSITDRKLLICEMDR